MSKKKLSSDAITLINLLVTKQIAPQELTPHQRKIIVKYYMENESDTSNTFIAKQIGVTDVHVSRLKRYLLQKAAWEIDQLDVKAMAVSLKKKKQEYQRKAAQKKDIALAWKIELDYIEAMQKLGFVFRAPSKLVLQTEQADFRQRLTEYFNEYGIPTAEQFFGLLETVRGNGGAKKRKLLVQPNNKRVSDRRH